MQWMQREMAGRGGLGQKKRWKDWKCQLEVEQTGLLNRLGIARAGQGGRVKSNSGFWLQLLAMLLICSKLEQKFQLALVL